MREFLHNKKALCPSCEAPFILTDKQLKNKVPKCNMCNNSKEAKQKRAAKKVFEDTFNQGKGI
jgi:ribosomal protein L37AE/L43A